MALLGGLCLCLFAQYDGSLILGICPSEVAVQRQKTKINWKKKKRKQVSVYIVQTQVH